MTRLIRFVLVFLPFCAAGCTQLGIMAANLPSHFDGIDVVRNVSFGPDAWQKLDIYRPADQTQPSDVVVFYYGGRWETGSKDDYRFVGSTLARQGFTVVIPDYRKYPTVRFPLFVQDAAKSLAWVSDNISRYNGNPARIHLAGHSAGAHIASLLTTDAHYLRAEGKDRSNVIHDFAGLAGPYDFVPTDRDLVDMFGPSSQYPLMQASTFVDGQQPPMLLMWGADDTLVERANMDRLAASVRRNGGCVATRIYPGVDHIWLVASLSWLGRDKAPVARDMTDFFHGVTKVPCY